MNVTFRNAERKDTLLILQFIKELADNEKMLNEVVADETTLETWKAILKKPASIAVERGCGRLEWWCLDWNKPSIDFYLSLGAEDMSDWAVYRIAGDTLTQLAE